MVKSQTVNTEQLRSDVLRRIETWYDGIKTGRFHQAALSTVSLLEIQYALLTEDKGERNHHLRKAAEAQKELFSIAWSRRDDPDYPGIPDGYGGDRSATGPVPAIRGMHAAMAAGEFELAMTIARTSGFQDDARWSSKDARIYADALRKLLANNDYSEFSQVPQKTQSIGWSDIATILLEAKKDSQTALVKLDEFERKRAISRHKDELAWQLAVLAIRAWIIDHAERQ